MGTVRGFMHAGARRVVASLWKVDDDATRELMRHFYAAMLRDRLPPAAALRQAQLAMRQAGPVGGAILLGGVRAPGRVAVTAPRRATPQ